MAALSRQSLKQLEMSRQKTKHAKDDLRRAKKHLLLHEELTPKRLQAIKNDLNKYTLAKKVSRFHL
jgi:hypothetical protein